MKFCADCSIIIFGRDFKDFAGLITEEKEAEGYGMLVFCDNCGEIYVNSQGEKITEYDEAFEHVDLREKK